MKKRFKDISHSILHSDRLISERIIELNNICMDTNNSFSSAIKQGEESNTNLQELAKKCVEISLMADSIAYELFLSNVVELNELNKTKKEFLSKL